MGKIRKILETELVGGTQSTDVYPVTSTKAVYDTNNKVLDDYIQHLKKTSTFAGIATPTTNPGTPDGPVFYIAGEGTYVNFSNIVIEAGQLGILKWNGTWSKEVLEIGAGGGSGSGVSLRTLLTRLNIDDPLPSANGQVLTYNGSNFVWRTPTSGSGGSTTGGIRIKRNGSTLKDSNGNVLSCTSINFKYGENWNSTPILINSDNEISVDLSVVANNGNGSSSSSNYPLTIYNGSSNTDYITYDGSSSAYLKFKSGFSISKVGLGYEISVSGGGSGSSGTTDYSLTFYKDGSAESWNGEKNFKIIFGNGLNVDWDTNHTYLTLSATGGSSAGGSIDLSSYLTKTEASTTYAAKSHTHSASNITDFTSTVKGITVDNASHADSANTLASSVYLWGNSFDGSSSIGTSTTYADLQYVKNIYTGNTFDIYSINNNEGHSVLGVDSNLNVSIAYGYRSNENATTRLFGNKTKIYTNGQNYHFDFVRNVFDVNSNQIHFGSETNGGKISWDAANNAFKIEGNVYATGGITALGVSNSATTSNNVDFTFNSVTSKRNIIYAVDNAPFKIYPKNNTNTPLIFSHNGVNWNIYDDNNNDIHLQRSCTIDSDGWVFSPQFHSNENGSMSLDGSSFYLGDTNNNVNVVFTYNGSKYRLDMSRAISVGVFTMLSTQELSALQERNTNKKAVL